MDKLFHSTSYDECNYLSMLGLKLNRVSKGAPGVSLSSAVTSQAQGQSYDYPKCHRDIPEDYG